MTDPTVLVLSSLADEARHGYAIMQDIAAFAGIELGPGTLYGAITRLEERGWIRPAGPRTRRQTYELTPTGRAHLKEQLAGMERVSKTAKTRLRHV